MNFNIAIIAGYDVLADESPDHITYVLWAVKISKDLKADLVIFVGGATNPDYPDKTEAQANYNILKEEDAAKDRYEIWEIKQKKCEILPLLLLAGSTNQDRSQASQKLILPVKVLPVGNTSAETLEAAKNFIEENNILVGRLILCAEESRITGFMLDAQMVELLDLPEQVFAYGHPFPESRLGFDSQRKKMLGKVLSHRSAFFRHIREIKQKIHQHKVARIKRQQR